MSIIWKACTSCCLYLLTGLCPWRYDTCLSVNLIYLLMECLRIDIHLKNVLLRLSSSINELSIDQFYKNYGEPETIPITRRDGRPLTPNVPREVVVPLCLGGKKEICEFSVSDTRLLLGDFGEAFSLDSEPRLGKACHTLYGSRAPEARFEPDTPLSYPSDIWSLATTIWEILGMKAVFSNEYVVEDEITAQQVDVLGPMP